MKQEHVVMILVVVSILAGILPYNIITRAQTRPLLPSVEARGTSSPIIYVNPSNVTVAVSQYFTVNVEVENVTDLHGWQAKLRWDPQLFDVVNVTEGDFLETGGATNFHARMTQSGGDGWIICELQQALAPGVNGSGILAIVTFHCTGLGGDSLDLYETKLIDSSPISVPTPPYLGDTNGDMVVDLVDVSRALLALGSGPEDQNWNPSVDFDNDSFVGIFDLECVGFNLETMYPGPALQPMEINHESYDGYATNYPEKCTYAVTWNWLNSTKDPVWLTANITIHSFHISEDFFFNRSLGQISFAITSATTGFCNLSVPKILMDGSFKVQINDTQVPCMSTWNETHTCVYFTFDQGNKQIDILGEIVTRIRGLDLLARVDVNDDGVINVLDVLAISVRFGWEEGS